MKPREDFEFSQLGADDDGLHIQGFRTCYCPQLIRATTASEVVWAPTAGGPASVVRSSYRYDHSGKQPSPAAHQAEAEGQPCGGGGGRGRNDGMMGARWLRETLEDVEGESRKDNAYPPPSLPSRTPQKDSHACCYGRTS
jgi:hypothetical protein